MLFKESNFRVLRQCFLTMPVVNKHSQRIQRLKFACLQALGWGWGIATTCGNCCLHAQETSWGHWEGWVDYPLLVCRLIWWINSFFAKNSHFSIFLFQGLSFYGADCRTISKTYLKSSFPGGFNDNWYWYLYNHLGIRILNMSLKIVLVYLWMKWQRKTSDQFLKNLCDEIDVC